MWYDEFLFTRTRSHSSGTVFIQHVTDTVLTIVLFQGYEYSSSSARQQRMYGFQIPPAIGRADRELVAVVWLVMSRQHDLFYLVPWVELSGFLSYPIHICYCLFREYLASILSLQLHFSAYVYPAFLVGRALHRKWLLAVWCACTTNIWNLEHSVSFDTTFLCDSHLEMWVLIAYVLGLTFTCWKQSVTSIYWHLYSLWATVLNSYDSLLTWD